MTYTENHLLLSLSGTVYGTDIFNFGLRFSHDTLAPAPEPPVTVPVDVVTACTTYFQHAGMVSNQAHLTLIKLNEIGVDGRYVEDVTVLHEIDPYVAGASSSHQPPQVSLAVSTTTAVTRGRAHAGRWYLPLPGYLPDTDGRLASAASQDAADAAATFVGDLNDALTGWKAAVMSPLGATHRITGIRVGRVLDTLRSRRSAFVEDYQIASV